MNDRIAGYFTTTSCVHGIPWEAECTICGRNVPLTYTARAEVVWTREDVDTIIRLLKEIAYDVRTKR